MSFWSAMRPLLYLAAHAGLSSGALEPPAISGLQSIDLRALWPVACNRYCPNPGSQSAIPGNMISNATKSIEQPMKGIADT